MRDDLALPVPWQDLEPVFEIDGSLRDIVVLDTGIDDWRLARGYLRGLDQSGAARVEWPDAFPPDLAAVFDLSAAEAMLLPVQIGDVAIHCHFFGPDEIEFDLDPKEVRSEGVASEVLRFISGLGQAVERPVRLTPENGHDVPYLTFDPAAMTWMLGSA